MYVCVCFNGDGSKRMLAAVPWSGWMHGHVTPSALAIFFFFSKPEDHLVCDPHCADSILDRTGSYGHGVTTLWS